MHIQMTEAVVYVKCSIYISFSHREFIGQILSFERFHYKVSVTHSGATLSSSQRFFAHIQDTDFAHHFIYVHVRFGLSSGCISLRYIWSRAIWIVLGVYLPGVYMVTCDLDCPLGISLWGLYGHVCTLVNLDLPWNIYDHVCILADLDCLWGIRLLNDTFLVAFFNTRLVVC